MKKYFDVFHFFFENIEMFHSGSSAIGISYLFYSWSAFIKDDCLLFCSFKNPGLRELMVSFFSFPFLESSSQPIDA